MRYSYQGLTTVPTTEHPYAVRDRRVVDYACATLPGVDRPIRGPLPPSLEPGSYFACLGAAQTFGCFCERPFPALLSERLGLPALNLGFGGAGPEYFLRRPALLEYANRARFVVVQAMSGRSADNSLFRSNGEELLTRRADRRAMGADEAYASVLAEHSALSLSVLGRKVYLGVKRAAVEPLIVETRRNWLDRTRELLAAIGPPTVWLWFSKRSSAYQPHLLTVQGLFGEFPQLIDQATNDAAGEAADAAVECVSRRGSPQPLVDRFTGQPARVSMGSPDRPDLDAAWTKNPYYPSPEMHEDAAAKLEPVCAPFL